MTYRDLLEALKQLNEEQLDLTATFIDETESFHEIDLVCLNQEDSEDQLGSPNVKHPIFCLSATFTNFEDGSIEVYCGSSIVECTEYRLITK